MKNFLLFIFSVAVSLLFFASCSEDGTRSSLQGPPNDKENEDLAANAIYELIAQHSQPATFDDLAPGSMDGFTCDVVNTAVESTDTDIWNLRTASRLGGLVYDARMQTSVEQKSFNFTFSKDPKKSLSTVALASQDTDVKDLTKPMAKGDNAQHPKEISKSPLALTEIQIRRILMHFADSSFSKDESLTTTISNISVEPLMENKPSFEPLVVSGNPGVVATSRHHEYVTGGTYNFLTGNIDPIKDVARKVDAKFISGSVTFSAAQPGLNATIKSSLKTYLCLYASKKSDKAATEVVDEVYFEFGNIGSNEVSASNMVADIVIETKLDEEQRDNLMRGKKTEFNHGDYMPDSVQSIKTVGRVSASRIISILTEPSKANLSTTSFCLSKDHGRKPAKTAVMTQLGRCYLK